MLYTGEVIYNATFVFFSSPDLSEGESYMLSTGETQAESAAQTGTVSAGMGNVGGPGGQKPDGDAPRSKPTGEMPQKDSGNAKA